MAVTSGFYNGLNNDRKYSATQLSDLFEGIITDGIFMSIGSKLMVVANTGMIVNVGTGRAWFDNTWTNNDAILPLEVPTSNIVLNRIDTVVLEVNKAQATRANTIKIVSGVAATSPVKATLTNNAEVTQYPLAYIYVGAGVTSIVQGNITNAVGTSECPFITGVMDGMDIDALILQWNSQFDIWFQAMKDQLTTDAAGNLQNQINTINGSLQNQINTINGSLSGFALKSSPIQNKTLTAAGWTGASAPFILTLPVTGITATNHFECLPTTNITAAQLAALQNGNIQYGGQSDGNIIFKAYGTKPAIDIPILVFVRGD